MNYLAKAYPMRYFAVRVTLLSLSSTLSIRSQASSAFLSISSCFFGIETDDSDSMFRQLLARIENMKNRQIMASNLEINIILEDTIKFTRVGV